MKSILDSQTVIWYVDQHDLLSTLALSVINDKSNELLISAATIWEVSIKVSINKLSLSLPYQQWMKQAIDDMKLTVLPISVTYANKQSELPWHHRDPFDRLIIAQSLEDNFPIISSDHQLDAYGVNRIW